MYILYRNILEAHGMVNRKDGHGEYYSTVVMEVYFSQEMRMALNPIEFSLLERGLVVSVAFLD